MTLSEEIGGDAVTNDLQVTQVWIKRKGRWQVVAEQATRIAED